MPLHHVVVIPLERPLLTISRGAIFFCHFHSKWRVDRSNTSLPYSFYSFAQPRQDPYIHLTLLNSRKRRPNVDFSVPVPARPRFRRANSKVSPLPTTFMSTMIHCWYFPWTRPWVVDASFDMTQNGARWVQWKHHRRLQRRCVWNPKTIHIRQLQLCKFIPKFS